jgi:hypothetical protein
VAASRSQRDGGDAHADDVAADALVELIWATAEAAGAGAGDGGGRDRRGGARTHDPRSRRRW